jgi:hypothetical protein
MYGFNFIKDQHWRIRMYICCVVVLFVHMNEVHS